MADPVAIISQNLLEIRQRIAEAAAHSGRDASDVRLVAVTKYISPDLVPALVQAGARDLGESRPQELWSKVDTLKEVEVRWHLVGHLQRNKVRRTLPLVHLIHSVDSLRLLATIDREAAVAGRIVPVLLEVNISGDPEKHGFAADQLPAILPQLAESTHVAIGGLMAMAHRQGGRDVARHDFAALRTLRDRLLIDAPANVSLAELSMGMSGDFEDAVREGATLVRIGRALYEGLEKPRS
ncbi:MAG: YggS family pyridoxal phosphate-dependent enzyme [Planctomycetota bacterium]|nr:YggS family pyridoxal phosphate-dependent enzyme [Planctomycetota bacterium]